MKHFFLLLTLLFTPPAHADNPADQAWAKIEVMAKGPGAPPDNAPEAAVRMARAHLAGQEKALLSFLQSFPQDPRRFQAELQLSGVTAALGSSLSDRQRVEQSIQRLAVLERAESTPTKYRADAAFLRITTTMQTVNLAAASRPGETSSARNTILEAAGNFAQRYPDDRRAARLLAEAATLLDDQPSRKRKILEQAAGLAKDDGTRERIADDLKRLDLLGRTTEVSFKTLQGKEFSLGAQRGRVVVLIFWAGWSPPSVVWLAEFAKTARDWPDGRVTVATVSLDRKKEDGRKTLEALNLMDWPTSCEGGGWDNALARSLGVNALPTVFVFDAAGRLRALNAREDVGPVVRQLLAEKTQVTR
ncbi:MAG: TlpA family protein disulfide reductase [Chthoniobacterales bacterium]